MEERQESQSAIHHCHNQQRMVFLMRYPVLRATKNFAKQVQLHHRATPELLSYYNIVRPFAYDLT